MYNDGPEFVQSIRVAHPVGRVEEPKFEREDDAVRELDVPLEALLVLEPFEVQRKDVGKLLDLHPVLLIHQPPTVAAPKKEKRLAASRPLAARNTCRTRTCSADTASRSH